MAPHGTAHVRFAAPDAGLDGAGPGLASVEAWAIALAALALLLVAARWTTSRQRRTERPRQH